MSGRHIDCVIFDLDGTILSTEQLVIRVASAVLKKYDRELTHDVLAASIGKTPLDAWKSVTDILNLSSHTTPQQLFDESESELSGHWHEATYLPGARRVLMHLQKHGHRLALATSSSRSVFNKKIHNKELLQTCFEVVVCGDDPDILGKGKPAPDCFLKVSKLVGISPSRCLVVEDAPSGVQAAQAAGMHVAYIPSLGRTPDMVHMDQTLHTSHPETTILTTLLEFSPEQYGLTPFDDTISQCIPMSLDGVWKISGHVVKGFGRGSKQLGIPTANVDAMSVSKAIPASVTGIFLGWASVTHPTNSTPGVYKMCCSIGFNPMFQNKEKSCEPWILHDFGNADFVGQPIKLLICGFIRPESSDFDSLHALIQRIHQDADIAREALDHEVLSCYQSDSFFLHAR